MTLIDCDDEQNNDFFSHCDHFVSVPCFDLPYMREKILGDGTNQYDSCIMCHEKFGVFTHRKIYCGFCGVFVCSSCSENKMANGTRVCDACSSVLFDDDKKLNGLKSWCELSVGVSLFNRSRKAAAVSYFACMLSNQNADLHKNAVLALYQFSMIPDVRDVFKHTTAIRALINHTLTCQCNSTHISLDLYLNLLLLDSSGTKISFDTPPLTGYNPYSLLKSNSINLVRAAARFLLLIVKMDKAKVSSSLDAIELIKSSDKSISNYILAALAYECGIESNDSIVSSMKYYQSIILNTMIKLRDRTASVATHYYCGQVLLKFSTTLEGCAEIIKNPTIGIADTMRLYYNDSPMKNKGGLKISVMMQTIMLNLWKSSIGSIDKELIQMNIFPLVIMPIFEIILGENDETEFNNLTSTTLELILLISKSDEYIDTFRKESLIAAFQNLENKSEPVSTLAKHIMNTINVF